ncbi:hypothetical protein K402DRAFT_392839, partial [Aulographum hederae CBS 113979]
MAMGTVGKDADEFRGWRDVVLQMDHTFVLPIVRPLIKECGNRQVGGSHRDVQDGEVVGDHAIPPTQPTSCRSTSESLPPTASNCAISGLQANL